MLLIVSGDTLAPHSASEISSIRRTDRRIRPKTQIIRVWGRIALRGNDLDLKGRRVEIEIPVHVALGDNASMRHIVFADPGRAIHIMRVPSGSVMLTVIA